MIRLAALAVLILCSAPSAAQTPQDIVLRGYRAAAMAQDSTFAGFSVARGEALFRNAWNGGDPRTPSCASCHTPDPRAPGRNAKTGRPIDPVAVSVNPGRFADMTKTEKQFARDCRSVLGRDCTAAEKGDYVAFMVSQ